jgi:hypothetical protein
MSSPLSCPYKPPISEIKINYLFFVGAYIPVPT